MEDEINQDVPFLSVLAPYGKTYWRVILNKWKEENYNTLIVVSSSLFKKNLSKYLQRVLGDKWNIQSENQFRSGLISSFDANEDNDDPPKSDIFGVYDRILYFVPNRIRPTILTITNFRLLELGYKDFDKEVIPQTIFYSVNTQSIPPLETSIVMIDKHEDKFFDNISIYTSPHDQRYSPDSNVLYQDMARKILRMNIQMYPRTLVFLVASSSECASVMKLFQIAQVSKDQLQIINMCNSEHSEKNSSPSTIFITDEIHMHLITQPVDVLVDCGIGLRYTSSSAIGGNHSFRTILPKNELLGRTSILETSTNLQTFGETYLMITQEEFNDDYIFKENPHYLLLLLGKTNIDPIEILDPTPTIHKSLLQLESVGALDSNYQTTDPLGSFCLDVYNILPPLEAIVLWTYLHQEWSKQSRSMWAVAWITSIISLFDIKDPYFMMSNYYSDSNLNSVQQDTKFKTQHYSDIIGKDDVDTYLNVWNKIRKDMETIDNPVDYYWWNKWGEENSLNGNLFRKVYLKAKKIIKFVRKYGFVSDDNKTIDIVKDGNALRKNYSRVYILNRLKRNSSPRNVYYKSYSTQSIYLLSNIYCVNTIRRTTPSEIVSPIIVDQRLLFSVLFRR